MADNVKRLLYIDSMRGLASLSVAIFWHYKHFLGGLKSNSMNLTPPLYSLSLARFLYVNGDIMVDLFFVLSGVIFSYTYRVSIRQYKVNKHDFFVKRLSRLYPIHIFTLLVTSILVYSFWFQTGRFPIYQVNDAYHFFLNIIFIQKGFFDRGFSFNAPAWSLSIEALMYLLFFVQARYLNTVVSSCFFVLLGFTMYRIPTDYVFFVNHYVARGLMGFFLGCLIYELLIKDSTYIKIRGYSLLLFIISATMYIFLFKKHIIISPHLLILYATVFIVPELHYNCFLRRILENKLFILFGDISLSLYLVHVPIQIMILLFLELTTVSILYDSIVFFLSYVSCVIIIGWISHKTIELPSQSWLRRSIVKR